MICISGVALTQFSAFLIYLLFASAVYHGGLSNMTQRKLLFSFMILFAADSFAAMIIMNSCTSYETARAAMCIASPFWFAETPVGFLLAVSFNGKSRIHENKYVYLALFIYVLVFTVLTFYGHTHVLEKMSYGWKSRADGLAGEIYSKIDDLLTLGSAVVFAVQMRLEKSVLRQRQGLTILTALLVTIVIIYSVRFIPAF